MKLQDTILCVLITMGAVLPSASQARVDLNIDLAPPAAYVEPVPPARPGFTWAPGYWDWDADHHVWHRGQWLAEHRGYHYEPYRWVQRDDHRWQMNRGHWERNR